MDNPEDSSHIPHPGLTHYLSLSQPHERLSLGQPTVRPPGPQIIAAWDRTWVAASPESSIREGENDRTTTNKTTLVSSGSSQPQHIRKKRRGNRRGRKGDLRRDDKKEGEDESEDKGEKERNNGDIYQRTEEAKPRYACQFYIHAPERYGDYGQPSCLHHWPTIHRLKLVIRMICPRRQ
jgi:hypothetical protein